jgi:uncharacterized protein
MAREDRIQEFEEELKKTKYNKKTQHHIGLVKAKIAKLKEEIELKKKGKGKTSGYVLKKSGDVTVVLVGFPSVGKSTLLNAITNAESKVAAYEFTTLSVVPGLLDYKHAKIQIFDVPGMVKGAAKGTGRGKEVLAAIRTADLIIMVVDINQLKHKKILENELYESGIRLNLKKPFVKINKISKGGISVASTVPLDVKKETFKAILNEFGMVNANVLVRSKINTDELIDVIEGNKRYMPGFLLINKVDTVSKEILDEVKAKYPDATYVSALEGINLDKLKDTIYSKLSLTSIFLKEPGKDADMDEPLIMREEDTLRDLCHKLHKDFEKRFRFARVWGKSARYDGQKITNLKHIIVNNDIVELHIM